MMQAATTPHACMLEAIARLRELGYKVGALTNNFQVPDGDTSLATVGGTMGSVLPQLFDDFVESSVVGMRKPDPRVFQLALDRLGVAPAETAFLDDLGVYDRRPREHTHTHTRRPRMLTADGQAEMKGGVSATPHCAP